MEANETPGYTLELVFVNFQNLISGDCHKKHKEIYFENFLNEMWMNEQTKKLLRKADGVWCIRNYNCKSLAFFTRYFPVQQD